MRSVPTVATEAWREMFNFFMSQDQICLNADTAYGFDFSANWAVS